MAGTQSFAALRLTSQSQGPHLLKKYLQGQIQFGRRRIMASAWHQVELLARRLDAIEIGFGQFGQSSQIFLTLKNEYRNCKVRSKRRKVNAFERSGHFQSPKMFEGKVVRRGTLGPLLRRSILRADRHRS